MSVSEKHVIFGHCIVYKGFFVVFVFAAKAQAYGFSKKDDSEILRISDDEVVEAFKGRPYITVVVCMGSTTLPLCRRLQIECGIQVVLGWENEDPLERALMAVMVKKNGFY